MRTRPSTFHFAAQALLALALIGSVSAIEVQAEVLNKSWNFTSTFDGVTYSGTFSLTGFDTERTYLDSTAADLRVSTSFTREGADGDAFTHNAGNPGLQVGGAFAGTSRIQLWPPTDDWLISTGINQTQGWFWYFPKGQPEVRVSQNPATVTAGFDGRPGVTDLVSVTSVANVAAGGHVLPRRKGEASRSVTADGRYVVFTSTATTLTATGGAPFEQVYISDRQTGVIEPVSMALHGATPDGPSFAGSISPDGRYVAFYSEATNLVEGDTNGWADVFVHDRHSDVTDRISVSAEGGQADGASFGPSISADGRHVAFASSATNLAADDRNGRDDVFVRDREAGVTSCVSLVTDDGRPSDSDSGSPSIRADGEQVAFVSSARLTSDDENDTPDIYVGYVRYPGYQEFVSYGLDWARPNAGSYQPGISADGRYVVFTSSASNLVPGDSNGKSDIFVRDRQSGLTERISVSTSQVQANDHSVSPSISYDGQFIAFESSATNLVPADTNADADVFLRDRRTGRTDRASVSSNGDHANATSSDPAVSGDGRFVAFGSMASNLVASDYNGDWDLYVRGFGGEVPPAALRFTIGPEALDFGALELFATRKTLRFWVTNKSGVPLPIVSMSILGLNPEMFSINHDCGASLPVSAACRVSVMFSPTSEGDKSATFRIVAGNDTVRTRFMTGTGVRSAFALSPRSLNFGGVPMNTSSTTQTVTITNTGSSLLPVESIALWGTNKSQFSRSHNCPRYVAVGGSCAASVRFQPTSAGAKSAHVAVRAGGGAGSKSVALYGTGH